MKNLKTGNTIVLSRLSGKPGEQVELFALINLGLVQSLASGILTPSQAIQRFYNAENCIHVKARLRAKEAQEIMSRGIQLVDLFDALSAELAQREFCRELETIRALCLKMLAKNRRRRDPHRAAA